MSSEGRALAVGCAPVQVESCGWVVGVWRWLRVSDGGVVNASRLVVTRRAFRGSGESGSSTAMDCAG
jgi:hypothetical protein